MIEICGVTRTYASTRALDGVSFCVPDGAVTGFVGPNGAGKSTLMRVATGLELPDSGSVVVDGTPLGGRPAGQVKVGALLEAGWVLPRRTARDHVRLVAIALGLPVRRIAVEQRGGPVVAADALGPVEVLDGGASQPQVGVRQVFLQPQQGHGAAVELGARQVHQPLQAHGLGQIGGHVGAQGQQALGRNGERVGVCGHKYREKVFFTRIEQGLFYPYSYKPLICGNAASGPAFA